MSEAKFRVEKAEDPTTLLAIRLREQLCDDRELSNGSVRMAVRLLDMSLNPYLNNGRRGEIIVSQMKLGCLLNCDRRSIRRRTDELVRTNYIWTSLVGRQNTKPILCYHLTAFQPKRQVAQEMAGDGLWGNGKRRFDSGFAKTGKEATGQNRRMGGLLLDQFGQKVFASLLENTPANGQNCPLPADKIDRCDRTELSSGSGQNCPVTADRIVLWQRSKLSGHSGQNCPVTEDASVRHKESQVGDSVPSGSKGEGSPPDLAFEASLKGLFPSRLEKLRAELQQKLLTARSEPARAEWRRRLVVVKQQQLGGAVPDEAPKPKPVRKYTEPVKKLSKAELLQSALGIIEAAQESGLPALLTAEHRAALKENGVKA